MKEPVACFTMPSTGTTGSAVSFDGSCCTDAHHYEWEFGDGGTGTGVTTTHIYNTAGTYTVKLKAMPKRGHMSGEITKSITIN